MRTRNRAREGIILQRPPAPVYCAGVARRQIRAVPGKGLSKGARPTRTSISDVPAHLASGPCPCYGNWGISPPDPFACLAAANWGISPVGVSKRQPEHGPDAHLLAGRCPGYGNWGISPPDPLACLSAANWRISPVDRPWKRGMGVSPMIRLFPGIATGETPVGLMGETPMPRHSRQPSGCQPGNFPTWPACLSPSPRGN